MVEALFMTVYVAYIYMLYFLSIFTSVFPCIYIWDSIKCILFSTCHLCRRLKRRKYKYRQTADEIRMIKNNEKLQCFISSCSRRGSGKKLWNISWTWWVPKWCWCKFFPGKKLHFLLNICSISLNVMRNMPTLHHHYTRYWFKHLYLQ